MSEDRTLLGEAAGDCLKAIYKLQVQESPVATSALAARLGVTEPTVTAMVKRLAKMGLVFHTPYRGVQLTSSGEKVALEIIRHHRLLELYLVEALGLSWDKVHAEADRLEHLLSEEVEERMDAALGHPTIDPHGDPIPTRDGQIDQAAYRSLADLEPGETATVRRVPDDDPKLLQYLAELGLVPNARIQLLDKAPFRGPLTLWVGENQRVVGRELAWAIRVAPLTPEGDLRNRSSRPSHRSGEAQ